MFLQLNAQNYIIGYATLGGIEGGIEVPDTLLEQIDPEKVGYYTYMGGTITLDTAKYNASVGTKLADDIRARRVNECFFYTDRGKFWYDSLPQRQLSELKAWYDAWLDAPKTHIVPMHLDFLR